MAGANLKNSGGVGAGSDGYRSSCCGREVPAGGDDAVAASKRRQDPTDPSPRTDYLSWDEYFMALAHLSAKRSKDPNKQVGACIVDDDNVILAIGYNGFPRGCADCDLPWSKESASGDPLDTKYPYVCHAEMNAIVNSNANLRQLSGRTRMYVTLFPCQECAKMMLQAGIREVVYSEGPKPKPMYAASQRLFDLAGARVRQFASGRRTQINL